MCVRRCGLDCVLVGERNVSQDVMQYVSWNVLYDVMDY